MITPNSVTPPERWLRLLDLAPYETIVVRCHCGRITEFGHGILQRAHHLTSDTLIFDLQFRLRCCQCNRKGDVEIVVVDNRGRGDRSKTGVERIVVSRGVGSL